MMNQPKILVCVTEQPHCSEMIRKGRQLADEQGGDLLVLHVRTRQKTLMGSTDISAALNQLYADAREAEAEMEIISSTEVEKTTADYAKDQQVTAIVIGTSPRDGRPSMSERLAALVPNAKVYVQ